MGLKDGGSKISREQRQEAKGKDQGDSTLVLQKTFMLEAPMSQPQFPAPLESRVDQCSGSMCVCVGGSVEDERSEADSRDYCTPKVVA